MMISYHISYRLILRLIRRKSYQERLNKEMRREIAFKDNESLLINFLTAIGKAYKPSRRSSSDTKIRIKEKKYDKKKNEQQR